MTGDPKPITLHSLSKRPVLVIGNSHTSAIHAAAKESGVKTMDVVNIATFFDETEGRNKVLYETIVDYFQPKHIFCTFGGSEHNVFGLLNAPVPFDFVTPVDDGFDRSRRIVPYAQIYGTLERAMGRALKNLEELVRLYDCPVVQICTPPPFQDVQSDVKLPRVFHARLSAGIAPAEIRRKLHYTHSEILRQHCRRLGVGFLEPPQAAVDSDGYLKTGYWKGDPTHGSTEYGRLVIKQIEEAVFG